MYSTEVQRWCPDREAFAHKQDTLPSGHANTLEVRTAASWSLYEESSEESVRSLPPFALLQKRHNTSATASMQSRVIAAEPTRGRCSVWVLKRLFCSSSATQLFRLTALHGSVTRLPHNTRTCPRKSTFQSRKSCNISHHVLPPVTCSLCVGAISLCESIVMLCLSKTSLYPHPQHGL